jgi:hypothetical protein
MNGTLNVSGNLALENSSTLTHSSSTTASTYVLKLKVNGRIHVDTTSKINVDSKGYLGGQKSGNSSNNGLTLGNALGSASGSGGSHGGLGGVYSTNAVNEIYGSLYQPQDAGSGGGGLSSSATGGNGGGVIRIEADELALDGAISANGEALNFGGGSGGSLWITARKLSGSGNLAANGGNSTNYAAGSGGRIALYYTDASEFDLNKITAYGGSNASSRNGSAGTIYLQPQGGQAELVIDNRGQSCRDARVFPWINPAAVTEVAANVLTDGNATYMPQSLVGMRLVPDITNMERTCRIIANDGATITTEPVDGDLTQLTAVGRRYSAVMIFDGHLKIRNTPAIINRDVQVASLSLTGNATLRHYWLSTSYATYLHIKAAGKVFVDGTSKIDVAGCGYLGGQKSGNSSNNGLTLGNALGSASGSGGSYGGLGGVYSTNAVNEIYGSLYQPQDAGSGGGGLSSSATGGNGGGIVRIEADELALDGSISVNGEAVSTGGGSGGSLWITARKLSGSGNLAANGGNSTNYGAGGGGRIALYYTDASEFDLNKVTAYGGNGNATSRNGGAGTVYLRDGSRAHGDLIIDNNNNVTSIWSTVLPAVGSGFCTGLQEFRLDDSMALWIPDSLRGIRLCLNEDYDYFFTVTGNGQTWLITNPNDGRMTDNFASGAAYRGEHHLRNLTVRNGAKLKTSDRFRIFGTLQAEPEVNLQADVIQVPPPPEEGQ